MKTLICLRKKYTLCIIFILFTSIVLPRSYKGFQSLEYVSFNIISTVIGTEIDSSNYNFKDNIESPSNEEKVFNSALRQAGPPTAYCKRGLTIILDGSGQASISPSDVDNGSFTDGLGNPILSLDISNFDCSDVGNPVTVTLTVEDSSGASDLCTTIVIVKDSTAPIPDVSRLPGLSAQCELTSLTPPTASDNCSGVTVTHDAVLPITTPGLTVVTWTYKDIGLNITTQTQTVNIDDTIAPVPNVSSLPTITAQCSATVIAPTATDNCSGFITGSTSDPTTYNAQGTYSITWKYIDDSSNVSTQTQTVIVNDDTAPVPDVAALPTITGQCSASVAAPNATDNCSGSIIGTTSNPTSYANQGTYYITWVYVDDVGNSSSQIQTVIVEDTSAPVPISSSLNTITRQCSVNVTSVPRARDNCNGTIIYGTTTDPTSFNTQGTFIITWTYTDDNGNSSTQTQTVIINDTIAPVPRVSSLPTITSQCSATVSAPRASDNCSGTLYGTTANPTTYTAQGTYTITWTYDDNHGNTSSQSQTVIINDTTAPVPNLSSLPIINAQCSTTVTPPTATDNCNGTIIGTTTNPTTYNNQGNYTINWTYTDSQGNYSTQSQLVVIEDTTAPNTPVLPDLSAECSLTVTPPTTTDNCDGVITGTTGISSLTFNTVGSSIIYWEFRDAVGNSIIAQQNVTITDSRPVPNASALSPQVFDGCQIVNINYLVAPTATDTCDGTIVGTLSPNFVFPYSFNGTETIDWEFIDSYGNVTIQSQDITLNPIAVDGGTLTGTFESTIFSNGIDISSCDQAINVALSLSGQVGTIVQWEKFAVNHGQWVVIPNTTTSFTASFAVGALESTYYRVRIQTGTCITYSNQFFIRALPVGSAPDITNLDNDALYCLGESVSLLATSTYTATQETIADSSGDFNQGQLNTQDPNGWLVDGDPGGFTAGGSATKPRNWSAKTCNNQANGDIVYCSTEGKFTIAYGDFSSNQYRGLSPTTLETPILDLSNSTSASLDFDQAFYFANNDYANIEISINGGVTYSPLRLMHGVGTGILKWFTAGTAASVATSNATTYNFNTDNTSIDLSAYLGETNVRIRWSFTGTTNKSVWAMDNIYVNKMVVVDTELEWTDGIGSPDEEPFAGGQTQVSFQFTPDAPGHHQYGTTALINNCRTYDEDGTALIDIYVSYSYAGQNVSYLYDECGRTRVQLNAYDNSITARQNATKGAFTLPTNCMNCDDEGTNEIGVWSIADNSSCGGATFSDINDPDAIFTAEAGTYTLSWTVAGCTSNISVTTTNCNQVNFDGTNDYVDFSSNNFGLNSGDFSIEAWVKPESINQDHTIFAKRSTNGSNQGYDLKVKSNGHVSFNVNQNYSISSSPYAINTSRWYHVGITYASGRYTMYIDGVQIKSNTGPAPGTNTYKAILGAMDNISNNVPQKHFNGWINEFRVWNVALSADQLHQMMNQRIISSPTTAGKVQGATIPRDINGLSWSNLSAYFQMDPSSVNCGYIQSVSSNVKGKLRNITTSQINTAPLPYTTRANGLWDANTTWTNYQVWDVPNSVGIDNTTPIDWNIVRTSHNITSTNRDKTVLGLLVDNNSLTVTGAGNQDETNSGTGMWVTHYLKLIGNIELIGESQLVQKKYLASQFSDSYLDPVSSGILKRNQQGTADKFTYNYWSSPVGVSNNTTNNNSYRVRDIMKDGNNNINWVTTGYNGTNTTPIGIADYWIWKFANLPDDSYASWQHVRSTGTIKTGEGFTMKGPGSGSISTDQNYLFSGKPNNGDIDLPLSAGNDYLVGNPYPSAIDGRQFILDNGSVIAGNGSTSGTLYFWEHWGGASHNLGDYQGGYATYNLSGGTPSASFGTNDPDVATGGTPTKVPGRYIPVGQGFFVVAEGAGGNVKFRNNQRIFKREGSSSVFLRNSDSETTTNYNPDGEDLRMKFRIGFNSVNTIHRQLLLTIDTNATADIDWGYDAKYIDDQMDDMYWMINNEKFNIQGRDDISTTSVIPLGLHLRNGGQNKISIDLLENVPDAIQLFVHDKVLDTYHNLRQQDYQFTLPAGIYLDRFEITFQGETSALSVNEDEISDLEFYYANTSESLVFENPNLKDIKTIELFNIVGQSICTIKPIEAKTQSEYKVKNLSTGTYIIKVTTGVGTTSKKVLVK